MEADQENIINLFKEILNIEKESDKQRTQADQDRLIMTNKFQQMFN